MNRDGRIGSLTFWLALVATILAIVAVGVTLLAIVQGSLGPDAWAVANTLALVLLSLILASLWVHTVLHEYRLFDRIGESIRPSEPRQLLFSVLISVVGLVALFPAAAVPALFACTVLILNTIASWNGWRARVEIRKVIDRVASAHDVPDELKGTMTVEAWQAEAKTHEDYYFGHPWEPLLATEMVLLSLAAALAAFVLNDANVDIRHVGSLVATLLIVAAVIGNEVVVAGWRSLRDRVLLVPLLGG